MDVMKIDLFRRSESIKRRGNSLGVPHDGDCALWLGQVSGFVPMPRTITRRAYWDSRRYQKKIRTIWRQHNGDCAFWSGQVSGFVRMLRTHHTKGVVGSDVVRFQYTRGLVVHRTMSDRQSPLPKKPLLDRDWVVANGREIRSRTSKI